MLYCTQPLVLPPRSSCKAILQLADGRPAQAGQLEIATKSHPGIIGPSGRILAPRGGGYYTELTNLGDQEIRLPAGTPVGQLRAAPRIHLLRPLGGTTLTKPAWTSDKRRKWLEEAFRLHENTLLQRHPDWREDLLKLLESHWAVYSTDGAFGKTPLVQHDIITTTDYPIKLRFRPINPSLEDNLRKQLDDWLTHDIIEESQSPWSFALVAVKKKNGKIRWCVDYRRLNEVTKKDSFPLPLIEDNLGRLSRSTIFSALDGMGAFHVVELTDEAKPKTAFATPWGSYQFKRMPFGLCNGPATYSRLMQLALQGVPPTMALPYLDDTIVHASDWPQHLTALDRVLRAHVQAGLKLQPEKCQLAQEEVDYLGHTVDARGIRPMKGYVAAVSEWPTPATKKQVRAFLGKVGYYQRFIPGYAALARRWTDALKGEAQDPKDGPVEVSEEMKADFQRLRNALVEAPILAYPRFDSPEPFILDTDWSQENQAIGGVLSQKQDGEERMIAARGKKLNNAQRNYPPTKGELYAAVYFVQKYRYYLAGRHFILRTDHRALQWVKTMEPPSGLVARWMALLSNFDFQVVYRPGTQHGNADAMSRIEHAEEPDPVDEEEGDFTINHLRPLVAKEIPDQLQTQHQRIQVIRHPASPVVLGQHPGTPALPKEWWNLQGQDPDLRTVRGWLQHDDFPEKEQARTLPEALKPYWELQQSLTLGPDGVVRLEGAYGQPTARVPCLPRSLIEEFVADAHRRAGHRGRQATWEKCRREAYHPELRARIPEVLWRCDTCQKKMGQGPHQRHTAPVLLDGYPFQRISVDFVGPLPSSAAGNRYLLTVEDPFSRWLEAFPLRTATAQAVMDQLTQNVFPRFGLPDSIHSDRGAQFTSQLLEDLAATLGCRLTFTPAYHPQSNPVERKHRDLKAALKGLLEDADRQGIKTDWEELLPQVLTVMRTSTCRSTGLSPFQILFGRDPAIPIQNLDPPPAEKRLSPASLHEKIRKHRDRIEAVHQYALANMEATLRRQRQYYRRSLHAFHQGELVWLYTPPAGAGTKFRRSWTGPWTIVDRINWTTYRIAPSPGWKVQKEAVVAADRLKAYYPPATSSQSYEPLEEIPPEAAEPAREIQLGSGVTSRNGTGGSGTPQKTPGSQTRSQRPHPRLHPQCHAEN